MVPHVASRPLSRPRQGPGNEGDNVRGSLFDDEGRVVLNFVKDPCLQPLEHMEVLCG